MCPTTRRAVLCYAAAGAATLVLPRYLFSQSGKVRPAPQMPNPRFIETNGIRMAVYEKGQGVPVVFCHGFPELAFSWRHQVEALSEAGFHAIAPDQRGYGLSDRPPEIDDYTLDRLCDDMAGLLDALDLEKAVFVGHDWGGGVVWSMVRLHPDRCLGVVGVNTPCQRPPNLPPVDRSEPSLIVRTENYYTVQFQQPGRAEAALERDIRHTFESFLRKGDIWNKEAFAKLPDDSPERQMDLIRLLQRENPPGLAFLPDDVMDYFVETFSVTGFTGGLNWYRAAPRSAAAFANAKWEIDVPCLYIGAEHDVILPPSSADGMEDFIPDLEKHTVMGSGHWTQQEAPEEVNRVLIDWLRRKLG